jgi:hypothetical protein
MCGGFQPTDIPYHFDGFPYYSVAACSDETKSCYPITSKYAQDSRPLNPRNFSEGIIIDFSGEPVTPVLFAVAHDWMTYFRIWCDPTQTSSNISLTPRTEVVRDMHRTHFQFAYSGACPSVRPPPSPTPTFRPRCHGPRRETGEGEGGQG